MIELRRNLRFRFR